MRRLPSIHPFGEDLKGGRAAANGVITGSLQMEIQSVSAAGKTECKHVA